MEKRFIVIECHELGDQYECDANREIQSELYTAKEIQKLTRKGYFDLIEVYEIQGTNIVRREDLSTYKW